MPNVIVSDTSCLILFYKIGELDLLKKLFDKLHITDIVLKEFNQPIPEWIEVVELKTEVHKGLSSYLDAGEATSIALASEYEDSLLIIDEIKGRKAAKELGIPVTGSLGVLITQVLSKLKQRRSIETHTNHTSMSTPCSLFTRA